MWCDVEERNRGTEVSNHVLLGLACVAAGAGLMYVLDPAGGARRRGVLRQGTARAARDAGGAVAEAAVDAGNRAYGTAREAWSSVRRRRVEDRVIVARVRSAMGRVVSHPSAIDVSASDGVVTLRGDVLLPEVDGLLRAVYRVPGVRDITNRLTEHPEPSNVPALQGAGHVGVLGVQAQDAWTLTTRLVATLGGAGMVIRGASRGGLLGWASALTGFRIVHRNLTKPPARGAVTADGSRRHAVDVQKTVNIKAPADRVFGFFANYRNFPQFMSNVRQVSEDDAGRSHWVVAGPAGLSVRWDADLTDYVPHERIAWRSVPGATVENEGSIRFTENPDGSTRVDIRLSYTPPAGALGHVVAKLFGSDPKSEMDADLVRAKTALETGRAPHDAAQPTEGRSLKLEPSDRPV